MGKYPLALDIHSLVSDATMQRVYEDLSRDYYLSEDFSVEFYALQAVRGFIAVGYTQKDDEEGERDLLLPEMQTSYCVLDFCEIKKRKALLRQFRRLSAYRLRVNTRPEEVMQRMEEYHGREGGGGSWLCTSYKELCRELFRIKNIAVPVDLNINAEDDSEDEVETLSFRLCSIELYDEEDNLVAGELGYLTGSVFTSLSGFCTREKRLSLGKIQILALAMRLEELGFKWLNLGQPPREDGAMRYKAELGGRTMERAEFIARWTEDIRCPARIEEFASSDVTLGHLLQTLDI